MLEEGDEVCPFACLGTHCSLIYHWRLDAASTLRCAFQTPIKPLNWPFLCLLTSHLMTWTIGTNLTGNRSPSPSSVVLPNSVSLAPPALNPVNGDNQQLALT